jgi:hypothetical protein
VWNQRLRKEFFRRAEPNFGQEREIQFPSIQHELFGSLGAGDGKMTLSYRLALPTARIPGGAKSTFQNPGMSRNEGRSGMKVKTFVSPILPRPPPFGFG